MTVGKDWAMQYWDEAKYVQVYINQNTTVYYNLHTDDYVRHSLWKNWRPSVWFYAGISIVLFAGDVIDPFYKEIVDMYPYVQSGFILLCLIMAVVCFEAINRGLVNDIDKEGVPLLFVEQEQIQIGREQLRQQCVIILS